LGGVGAVELCPTFLYCNSGFEIAVDELGAHRGFRLPLGFVLLLRAKNQHIGEKRQITNPMMVAFTLYRGDPLVY
jgi:hypothetical protein